MSTVDILVLYLLFAWVTLSFGALAYGAEETWDLRTASVNVLASLVWPVTWVVLATVALFDRGPQ